MANSTNPNQTFDMCVLFAQGIPIRIIYVNMVNVSLRGVDALSGDLSIKIRFAPFCKEVFSKRKEFASLVDPSQQAKNIGPTLALNGYLYGSYMGNP